MIKKTLYILSLLSIPAAQCMESETRTITITETRDHRTIVSALVNLIEQAKNQDQTFEERLSALAEASEKINQLKGRRLNDIERATLSRAFGAEIQGTTSAVLMANLKRILVNLRTTITTQQLSEAPVFAEEEAVRYEQQETDAFATIQEHAENFSHRFTSERASRLELVERLRNLETTLHETISTLRAKEKELAESETAIEDLSGELEATSLKHAEQTTENIRLRTLLVQVTETKRKLEQDAQNYKTQANELARIVTELQSLEEE